MSEASPGFLCGYGVPYASKAHVIHLLGRIDHLGEFPRMGRPRPEYGAGKRGLILDSYLVLYDVMESEVRIARVIHSRRDIDRELGL